MNELEGEEPELEKDEDASDDDEPLLSGTSFFAVSDVDVHHIDEIERTDELVCARVWNMFAKKSNADGFDCRSRESRVSSVARAKRLAEGKGDAFHGFVPHGTGGTMATEEQALAAYRELRAKLGRVPTNPELADALGIKGTTSAKASAVSRLRAPLIERGLVEAAPKGRQPGKPRGSSARRSPVSSAKPAPTPRTPAPPVPPRRTSKDPTVAALIERRDALLHKAKALDVAIEALSEAL